MSKTLFSNFLSIGDLPKDSEAELSQAEKQARLISLNQHMPLLKINLIVNTGEK